jgi:futalosine hydrolase
MHILIVAATESEVADLKPRLERNTDLLITGVGMVATAVRCARLLAQDSFDLVLNVGLCGSFDPALTPGTVVHVVRDRIAELGAEDGDAFLTMADLNLPAECEFANMSPPNIAALAELQAVSGVTVNTAHGNARSIAALAERFSPQVESMEGAAFMSACLASGVRFAQVRAVSNMVTRRNRAAWRIADAVAALARTTLRIVEGL